MQLGIGESSTSNTQCAAHVPMLLDFSAGNALPDPDFPARKLVFLHQQSMHILCSTVVAFFFDVNLSYFLCVSCA